MKAYPKMKDSGIEWIGKIPEIWLSSKLKHICVVNPSKSKVYNLPDDYSVSFLPMEKIGEDGSLQLDENKNLSDVKNGFTYFENGDVIVAKITPCFENGKGSLCTNLENGIGFGTTELHVLRPSSSFDQRFMFYWTRSNPFLQIGESLMYGSAGQKRVPTEFIRDFLIVYPQSELEQKQISDYLDSQTKLIDSQIESNQKLVTLLHEKRQATINQAVTKGLDPTVPMKDSGVEWIGEIPEEWISTKLWILVITNQLELQDGNHGEIHPNPEEFETIGIPFIKPKDIQNERVKWESCDRLPIERCEKFRIGFSKNNDILLVNRGGSIGKICFVNDYQENNSFFMINPQVTYLRTKKTLNSKYLFYISLSNIFTCELDLISGHGATFTFLGLSNMGKFNIILPSFQEQKQIAEFLDTQTSKIDSLIHKTESQIEKLQEFRQSLISAAVTGKIDVRKEVIAQ